MNAKERYLAVYDEEKRKKLERVPSFVQYIRKGFIKQYKKEWKFKYKKQFIFSSYFAVPYQLGFDSIFAAFPRSVKIKPIKIEDENGQTIKIGKDGQATKSDSEYYEKGYIQNLDILNDLRANMKIARRNRLIKIAISFYEKISPKIFPVATIDGIFDRVWRAMGMVSFSKNFRKRTKLYQELIQFYADIAKINIEKLIDTTGNRAGVVNILDDVAFKGRSMISPERWKQDFLPHYKDINSILKDAGIISQVHTDGDVTELIPAFQDAGFRGLQGWEGGCDPQYINDHFPNFVVIGFGDVSDILPHGTPIEVDAHVKNLMDIFKENRHFIIGPSTVIYKKILLENVKVFMSAIQKYGKYEM